MSNFITAIDLYRVTAMIKYFLLAIFDLIIGDIVMETLFTGCVHAEKH